MHEGSQQMVGYRAGDHLSVRGRVLLSHSREKEPRELHASARMHSTSNRASEKPHQVAGDDMHSYKV